MSNRWDRILKELRKAGYVKTRRTTDDVVVFENNEGCIITVGLGVIAARKVVDGKVMKTSEYDSSKSEEGVRRVIQEINSILVESKAKLLDAIALAYDKNIPVEKDETNWFVWIENHTGNVNDNYIPIMKWHSEQMGCSDE